MRPSNTDLGAPALPLLFMSVKPIKTNTWKLQRCKACGERWGKSLIHGIGLVCRECWATLAPPALAGKGHKAERKAEKIDRLLREHQPPPMARSAEMLELRGCARCGGAVNWIRTTDRAPGWWEGECVGCGDIRFSRPVADAKLTRLTLIISRAAYFASVAPAMKGTSRPQKAG